MESEDPRQGNGWSKETIRDDINDMKALGYPIKFDTRQNGYIFTEKFTGIPTAFITESEFTRLLLVFHAIESLKGSPLFGPVEKALQKLSKALTDRLGIDVAALKSTVTIRSTGVDPMVDLFTIDTLMKAILNHEGKLHHADGRRIGGRAFPRADFTASSRRRNSGGTALCGTVGSTVL